MLSQPPFCGTDASGREVLSRLRDATGAHHLAIAESHPQLAASTAVAEQYLFEFQQCVEAAIAEDCQQVAFPRRKRPPPMSARGDLYGPLSMIAQSSHIDCVHGGVRCALHQCPLDLPSVFHPCPLPHCPSSLVHCSSLPHCPSSLPHCPASLPHCPSSLSLFPLPLPPPHPTRSPHSVPTGTVAGSNLQ